MLIFLLLCVSVRSFIIPHPFLIPRFEIRNGNSLRLFRVKEQDEGTYTCTSENSVGKTEASAMLQVHGKKHIMHIVFEHTHTHFCMHKKSHVPRACVHAYTNMQSHDNSVIQIPISCPTLSVFISVHLSPRPVVLPRAYAKPNGLRHLTDVW